MTTKLRIKVGQVEVECEGSDDFLRKELPELLRVVLELRGSSGDSSANDSESTVDGAHTDRSAAAGVLSTSTVAAKIDAKTGSDLTLAAVAALVIGGRKDSVSRGEILKAMQSAKAYYKTTYRNNLSKSLATLVKAQDLLDQGNEHFGLQQAKRNELAKKLA